MWFTSGKQTKKKKKKIDEPILDQRVNENRSRDVTRKLTALTKSKKYWL